MKKGLIAAGAAIAGLWLMTRTAIGVESATIKFESEQVCESGHMEGDFWVCTSYFTNERAGAITIINTGMARILSTNVEAFGTVRSWTDQFEGGERKDYRFSYATPTSGMPLNPVYIEVVSDGEVIAEKNF